MKNFAVDEQGKLVLSPALDIEVGEDGFDIQDLNAGVDSATITATNLDIRNLSGNWDSVMEYAQTWVTGSDSGSVSLGTIYLMPVDISLYSTNYFLVYNTSGVLVTITLQVAPVDSNSYYTDDGSSFSLLGWDTLFLTSDVTMKYARIKMYAALLGSATVYYFGQT